MAEAGIEAMFILDIDPEERLRRMEYQDLEFIWRPMYNHLGRKTEMLGHVFYDFYANPLDLEITDEPDLSPKNATRNDTLKSSTSKPKKIKQSIEDDEEDWDWEWEENEDWDEEGEETGQRHLRDYILTMSEQYRTKHLLMMVG